LSCTPRARMP